MQSGSLLFLPSPQVWEMPPAPPFAILSQAQHESPQGVSAEQLPRIAFPTCFFLPFGIL